MEKPNRVLLIGGKLDDRQLLPKIKQLGIEVFAIQKPELFDETYLTHADGVLLIDYEDPHILLPIARTIYDVLPFKAVISLTESGLVPAALVNDDLGLAGNSLNTTKLLKNKWEMRQHLNALGVSSVAARLGKDEKDLLAFVRDYGLPAIVKPTDESGSYGVMRVNELKDIASTWDRIGKLGLSCFLMEEYLEGKEISVETFSFNGKHLVLAVTDKLTLPNFVEQGHSVPAKLADGEYEEVVCCVTQFLETVGLQNGAAHTEIKLTPKGPRIVESHNRVGGDKINELVKIACGIDMISLTFEWALGRCEALNPPPALQAGAAVRFFVPQPGTVTQIDGLEEVRNGDGVVELELDLKVGSQVRSIAESLDRSGHLLVQGANVDEAVTLCDRLMQNIHIVTC
jgi:biotin carboxylase